MHRLSLVQLERVAFPSAITLCLLPSSVAAPAPACPPARARLSKPQVPHLARRPPSPAPARHHRHPRRRDARAPARARDGRDALAAAVGGGAEGAPARQGGAGWAERRGGGGGARQAREGELRGTRCGCQKPARCRREAWGGTEEAHLGLDLVARPHRHGHVLPLRPDALDAQFLAPETVFFCLVIPSRGEASSAREPARARRRLGSERRGEDRAHLSVQTGSACPGSADARCEK